MKSIVVLLLAQLKLNSAGNAILFKPRIKSQCALLSEVVSVDTPVRRQAGNNPTPTSSIVPAKIMKLLQHGKQQSPADKAEIRYQPYLFQGDWVFKRTTRATTLGPGLKSNVPWGWQGKSDEYRCDVDCLSIYWRDYGPICGLKQSFRDNPSIWKEFNNICELDYENCRHPNDLWKLVHRGTCPELHAVSGAIYPHGPAIRSRAMFWINQNFTTPLG